MKKNLDERELQQILGYLRSTHNGRSDIEAKISIAQSTVNSLPFGYDWSLVQFALGNLYINAASQGDADAATKAIECFNSAKPFRSKAKEPRSWALLHNSLSVAWRRNPKGEKSENIEKALAALAEGLSAYPPMKEDDNWANMQGNLSNIYFDRIKGDVRENKESSIEHQQRCLNYFRTTGNSERIARSCTNLGKLYEGRIKGNRRANLETAIGFYSCAIETYSDRQIDTEWARANNNLGVALYNKNWDDKSENLYQSVHHFNEAMKVWTKEDYPSDYVSLNLNLGNAFRKLAITEKMSGLFAVALNHLACAAENRSNDIDTRLLIACAKMRCHYASCQWPAAISTALRAMTECVDHINQSNDIFSRRRLALRYNTAASIAVHAYFRSGDIESALRIFYQSRNRLSAGIQPNTRNSPKTEIKSDTVRVCICLFPREDGPAIGFIESRGIKYATAMELPNLTASAVDSLLRGDALSWLPGYEALLKHQDYHQFDQSIANTKVSLETFLAPVLRHLDGLTENINRLEYFPNGPLAMFPLTMLDLNSNQLVGDRYSINHPVWPEHSAVDSNFAQLRSCLAISNPANDLLQSEIEANYLVSTIGGNESIVLNGISASKQAVLGALRNAQNFDVIHISCHGKYGWRQPEKSRLLLSDGDMTYEELRPALRIKQGSLVVLSACETGMGEYEQLPDDFYGLPTLFLEAGAGHVICSLWPVSDRSTRQLMENFYSLLVGGKSPPESLQLAQHEIRNTKPSGHEHGSGVIKWGAHSLNHAVLPNHISPYYWSGFVCLSA